MNLQLNDPAVPAPGEMIQEGHRTASPQPFTSSPIISSGDPHHYRAPSLGEIHQELEQEQEAQVVRTMFVGSLGHEGATGTMRSSLLTTAFFELSYLYRTDI
jgi:hypothetical protein